MDFYIIPSPIGNLDDITIRAINVIKEVDFLVVENKLTTKNLLKNLKLETKKIFTYNDHSTKADRRNILSQLKEGLSGGIISDAGTPLISDPGYKLISELILSNVNIISLPGPTALIPALAVSGLPTDRFTFEGFLPVKKGRKTRLEDLSKETRTMIFYESPYKLYKTLKDFYDFFGGDREISISKEITKIFEFTNRGKIIDLIGYYKDKKLKGEFVIVVKGLK